MDTDRADDSSNCAVLRLMRLLTHLNAGGMLALCLWLSLAALDFNASHTRNPGAITVHGCSCSLDEITDRSTQLNMAADGE